MKGQGVQKIMEKKEKIVEAQRVSQLGKCRIAHLVFVVIVLQRYGSSLLYVFFPGMFSLSRKVSIELDLRACWDFAASEKRKRESRE